MLHEHSFWPGKGYILRGNVSEVPDWLAEMQCKPAVVIADPPYGDILPDKWDKANLEEWIALYHGLYRIGAPPIYWWGGIGKPRVRPFFEFILQVERNTNYRMRDLITWKKKRAYGKSTDYLFVREECALMTDMGKPPPTFNIPLLEEKRGYPGFNKDYPAKSEFKRRGNVWDETERMRDLVHPAQKAAKVMRIPIEVNTNPGELVLDLYSESGETSVRAIETERMFIAVEQNPTYCKNIAERLELALTGNYS